MLGSMVSRPLATLSIGPCAGVFAQHPPFMPCARCHVYTFRYRWRSALHMTLSRWCTGLPKEKGRFLE